MTQITIDVPENMKELPALYWILGARKLLEEQEEKRKKIARIREIAAKSKATDKDVEEITNEVKESVWKHYKRYAE